MTHLSGMCGFVGDPNEGEDTFRDVVALTDRYPRGAAKIARSRGTR